VASSNDKSIPQVLRELWELLQAYAKQETVGPLKGLGAYLGFGVGGSVLLALGVFFVSAGLLRGLQTQTTWFDGPTSMIPYLLVVVVLIAVIGASVWRIKRSAERQKA
jgi:hypothetical protein